MPTTSLSAVDLLVARAWLLQFGTGLVKPRQFTEYVGASPVLNDILSSALAGLDHLHRHDAVKRWLYGRESLFFELPEGAYRFALVGYRWRLVPRGERADVLPSGPDPADLARAWLAAVGMAHVTIAEVIAQGRRHPNLARALAAVAPPTHPADLCSDRRLGRWLVKQRDRAMNLDDGPARFVMRDRRGGHSVWQVFPDRALHLNDLDEVLDTEVAVA